VLREGAIAAGLTALMILIFLWFLALHAGRDDFNPARDPVVARGAVFSR